jgi:hypothetical protein
MSAAVLTALLLTNASIAEDKYEPAIQSLRQHECPHWFRDAKFVSPGNTRIGDVQSVKMLGHAGDLDWELHPDGLRVTFPEVKPCDFAYGLKIHVARNAE